jgi:hypothetical protein
MALHLEFANRAYDTFLDPNSKRLVGLLSVRSLGHSPKYNILGSDAHLDLYWVVIEVSFFQFPFSLTA